MNFLEAFPETKVAPPQMPGMPAHQPSQLHHLRLAQLRDIARAWEIQIDMDAPKPSIMPAMLQAEQSGTFRTPAKHEAWLRRAMVDPDERYSLDPATSAGMTQSEYEDLLEDRQRRKGGRPRKELTDDSLAAPAEG